MNQKIKKTEHGFYVMVDDTHISRWTEQEGRLDHARNYLAKFKHVIPLGGVVIDGGACIGDHTVTYAQMVGPTGKVLAFEANKDVHECCSLNLSPYPWAEIINKGLGEDEYEAGIDVSENVGASRLNASGTGITITKLDSYTDRVHRCDLLKADIEGFEHKMLIGARNFIFKHSPAILLEVNRGALAQQGANEGSIFRTLTDYGYTWSACDGELGSEQYDIIATKFR